MDAKYYIATDDEKPQGPYHLTILKTLYKHDKITEDTLVCEEGGKEWVRFRTILEQEWEEYAKSLEKVDHEHRTASMNNLSASEKRNDKGMSRYYVLKSSGEMEGPYFLSTLRTFHKCNKIKNNTQVCPEGGEKWITFEAAVNSSSPLNELKTNSNKSGSLLPEILVALCVLSIGGGVIMGIMSLVAGFVGAGLGYILGGAAGGVLWYTLYVLLTKK